MSLLESGAYFHRKPGGGLQQLALKAMPYAFAFARRHWPIPGIPSFHAVVRYDDVLEAFATDQLFDAPYAENLDVITGGVPFFLGLRDTPQYHAQLAAMRAVVRDEDLDELGRAAEARARQLVEASGGQIDVVQFIRRVAFDLICGYFGVPPATGGQIDVWATRLFEFQFTGSVKKAEWRSEAETFAAAFRDHLDGVIAARKRAGAGPDDILGRCLAAQAAGLPGYSDAEIRTQLLCMVVGGPPQPAMVLPQALEQLLRRPLWLSAANGAACANKDDRLRAIVTEAMRFDPLAPGLFRQVIADGVIARGTPRARRFRKGSRVFVAFSSAMMDPRRVSNPRLFDPDRPAVEYVHFGHGLHECFGRFINRATLHLMLKPLLAQPGLRRARGRDGKLTKRGTFAERLVVDFG